MAFYAFKLSYGHFLILSAGHVFFIKWNILDKMKQNKKIRALSFLKL